MNWPPKIGTFCRDFGATKMIVVATDDRFAYVVRADAPKKNRTKAASYLVARGDYESDWTEVAA